MTYTRTKTDLKGAAGSPATVAAGSSDTTSALATASGGTLAECVLAAEITIGGTAPGTNPLLQPQYSLDGTKFFSDGGPYVVPITATGTSYDYSYTPPVEAVAAQLVLTNGTGQSITWFAQGTTYGVS